MTLTEIIGWLATTVFVGSYFCRRADTMRLVQVVDAVLWVTYGILLQAAPVIAANLLVMAAATWTSRRRAQPVSPASNAADGPARSHADRAA